VGSVRAFGSPPGPSHTCCRVTLAALPDSLIELVQGEFDYLVGRDGREFFLALTRYANALHGKRRTRKLLSALEVETCQALERFVAEQGELIEEAKAIRIDLARLAPEIDNSDIAEPDHRSHAWTSYDLDSFASFDKVASADLQIGYPVLPRDDEDPGPVSKLLQILRGRLRTAEYGKEASTSPEQIRDDLEEIGRRIGNLGSRARASLQRYRQDSRTLPGIAFARLVYFGSDLVDQPVQIETDEDVERLLDRSIREWLQPKGIARKLANGEPLDDVERRLIDGTEATLKGEVDGFHRELLRRLVGRRSMAGFVGDHAVAFAFAVAAAVVGGLILYYAFGIGR